MATYFDALCNFAESRGNSVPMTGGWFRRIVSDSRLFEIESRAPQDRLSDSELQLLNDDLHLPFDAVAVEDADSCVLIADVKHAQPGIQASRLVAFSSAQDGIDIISGGILTVDSIVPDEMTTTIFASSMFNCLRIGGSWGEVVDEEAISAMPGWREALHGDLSTHYLGALREILFTNVPSNFILESSPLKLRNKPRKIPRSHERPTYTLLRPTEIRRRMGLSEVTDGGGKAPHERRGHFRCLRDERYTRNPDGTPRVIWIPATWVGPSEAIMGTRRYRVILD